MKLHYKKLGSGRPLVILHGVFGMLDNWITLGRRYAAHFEVYLVDQRNHGKSPHSDEFTFADMADDLLEFIDDMHIRGALMIGHSMGGKTLMEFANDHACFVDKMVIADIGPKAYRPHHGHLIAAMETLDLPALPSRKAAEEKLAGAIPSLAIRQFLLKNLHRNKDGTFVWKVNLPAIKAGMHEILKDMTDYRIAVPALFLRGGNSDYILPEDEPVIRRVFPNSRIVTIPGAGHWLHAEQPELFYRLTMDFFEEG